MGIPEGVVRQFCPVFQFSKFEQFFPCSIETLLTHASLKFVDGTYKSPVSQSDLERHFKDGSWIEVARDNHLGTTPGSGEDPPVYVAIQEFDDCVEINYLLLYAYQGGQTVQAKPPLIEDFGCILHTYGEHQGDLERVAVRIVPSSAAENGYRLSHVCYEAHGKEHWHEAGNGFQCVDRTHPWVSVALNGHSSRPERDRWVVDASETGVQFISVLDSAGVNWCPWEVPGSFRRVGLDDDDHPLHGQAWAKFRGKLGQAQKTRLRSATDLAGRNLSGDRWTYVKAIDLGASVLGKLEDFQTGDGPDGLGAVVHDGNKVKEDARGRPVRKRPYIAPGSGSRLIH